MSGSLQWTVMDCHSLDILYQYIHYITLHYIPLHYTTLIKLHYMTLHYITLHYITLHYTTLHYITLHYIALHCIALHYIALHCITLHCIALHTYMSYHTIKRIHHITIYLRPVVHPYCPTAIIFQLVLGAEYPWDPKEVDAEQHSLDAMHGGYRIHRWWCIGCHLSMIFFLVKFMFLLGINGFWLKGIYQVWEWTKASTAIMCKFHNMHHHWTVRNLRRFATCAS